MRCLSANDVHARKVVELGLDPTAVDLASLEAISGAIRRVASFLCPCSAATLIKSVLLPLRGLVDNLDKVNNLIEETLEAIIAHGDIIEQSEIGERRFISPGALLYAAPPSFVLRSSGTVIILGVATDQLSALPEYIERRIEYRTYIRYLVPHPGEDLSGELIRLGFIQLEDNRWLKVPLKGASIGQVSRLNKLLDTAHPSREIPGLSLLDPERPVRYYRGRWVEPESQTGRFVARRRQAYGADLWCYVQMRNGHPERLIDFPLKDSRWRGCDEAWHLQMAIDKQRGEPQRYRLRPGPGCTRILELFSPVPMWARRRWDVIGEFVPSSGCLLAFRLAENEIEEELRFVDEMLWLEKLIDKG